MVTRGPGATHAAGGIHTAHQDSTPLILLIGQVARDDAGREAFQEIDYRQMFGPMAKWVAQIDEPAGSRSSSRGRSRRDLGRPGAGRARAARGHAGRRGRRRRRAAVRAVQATRRRPKSTRMRDALAARGASTRDRRRGTWNDEAHGALTAWSPGERAPGRRRGAAQDYVDNTLPGYAGAPRPRSRPAARPARAGGGRARSRSEPGWARSRPRGYTLFASRRPSRP